MSSPRKLSKYELEWLEYQKSLDEEKEKVEKENEMNAIEEVEETETDNPKSWSCLQSALHDSFVYHVSRDFHGKRVRTR